MAETARADGERDARPAPPSAAEVYRFFLRLGLIGFGGPAGQIAMMHRELVGTRRWISERRFLHGLNFSMLLPGPEATQLAIHIGWRLHGPRCGVLTGLAFVLPGFAVLTALTWLYLAAGDSSLALALLYGVKPAVVAIVALSAWQIGGRALDSPVQWAIAIGAFIAIAFVRVPFPYVLLAASLVAVLASRLAGRHFQPKAPGAQPLAGLGAKPAVVDDDTPTPAYARHSRTRLAATLLAFVAAWLALIAMLALATGFGSVFTQMGIFFGKVSVLMIGGANAVLPYIHQEAVETFGWLSTVQMIDGLALSEATPGPRIMLVAFVGFVATWHDAVAGGSAPVLAGLGGAVVAAASTFLPAFMFILAGGPLVESTRGQSRLAAPLAGITAAAVGVIAALALFFATHTLRPPNPGPWTLAGFDLVAVGLGVVATVALLRSKLHPMLVIAGCALIGLTFKRGMF